MEHFSEAGQFWLPDKTRRVPGLLTYDGDGLQLKLYDSLLEFDASTEWGTAQPEWVSYEIMHGRLFEANQEELTLCNVTGFSFLGPFNQVSESYRAAACVRGRNLSSATFTEAWVEFDVLNGWADPPQLARQSDSGAIEIPVRTRELAVAVVDDTRIRLVATAVGTWGTSVDLRQTTSLHIKSPAAISLADLVDNWVRPLQNMLVVALGRPVSISGLTAHAADQGSYPYPCKISLTSTQRAAKPDVSVADIRGYGEPTLQLYSDEHLPFAQLVPAWFELNTDPDLADVVVRLCAPFYASFIFGEHRYADFFQAAEGLARKLFDTRRLPRAEHRELVAQMEAALLEGGISPDDAGWARRVLGSRNDRSLRDYLNDLVASLGAAGDAILEVHDGVVGLMVDERTGVSHGGKQTGAPATRHWLADLVLWMVRGRLLVELGVPSDVMSARLLGRVAFTNAIDRAKAELV